MANGVNANQVHRWMRERGISAPTKRLPASPPNAPMADVSPAFIPLPLAPTSAAPESPGIRIEIRRGNAAIKIDWPVSAASDCAALLRDWLR